MENQYLPHVLIRFAQVWLKWKFRAIAEEPSSIQVMPEKPVTPLIRMLDLSPPPCRVLRTCGRNPSRIMRVSDAPKTHFRETLTC